MESSTAGAGVLLEFQEKMQHLFTVMLLQLGLSGSLHRQYLRLLSQDRRQGWSKGARSGETRFPAQHAHNLVHNPRHTEF